MRLERPVARVAGRARRIEKAMRRANASVAADLTNNECLSWIDSCGCALGMSGEVALEVSKYWKRALQAVEDT